MLPSPASKRWASFNFSPSTFAFVVITWLLSLSFGATACGAAQGSGLSHITSNPSISQSKPASTSSGHLTVSGTMPSATMGVPYQATVTASGAAGPFGFAVIWQTLPPGLSLNARTGQITGMPTAAGTYNFSVSATTQYQTYYGDHRFAIVVSGTKSEVSVTVSPATSSVASGATEQFAA